MRIPRSIAIGIVSLFCLSPALHAQCSERDIARMESSGFIYPDPVPHVAYIVSFKLTTVQNLANGVTITHESHSKEARDSSGRTYIEDLEPSWTLKNFNDPVNHTNVSWNTNDKILSVLHGSDADNPAPAVAVSAPRPAEPPCRSAPNGSQIEDLGTRTIQGVTTTGTRITHTIKAGSEGNDLAFNVIVEVWYSADLNMNLLKITDDPRTGTQTREATDVQRGEPDPSLFQIPEGYTVHDVYADRQN